MSAPSHGGALDAGLEALGLALAPEQRRQLLAYLGLIAKWNKVYNLTAVRDPADMLTHHVLDSLAALGPLQRHLSAHGLQHASLLDVGSGAGLPGVVFAIGCPGLQVSCVDTVSKKAAFIQQAAGELGLKNLRGVHARVESLTGPLMWCPRAPLLLWLISPLGRVKPWPRQVCGWP